MSIISDALKKADSGPGLRQELPLSPPSRSLWAYRAALLCSIGVVLAGLGLVTRRASAPVPAGTVSTATAESAAPKNPGLQLLRKAQGEMGLSGTIRGGGGESLALLDNQIVQKGDRARGMTVVQVTPDSIELQDKSGKTKTLKLED